MDTKAERTKLKVRPNCYWRTVEVGAHLGYRKLKGRAGRWFGRFYLGEREYDVERLGVADDDSDADGAQVLSYQQAVTKVRELREKRAKDGAGIAGPFTVAQAMTDYLAWMDEERKSGYDSRKRSDAHIIPALGKIEVANLKTKQIKDWHLELSKQLPRLRTEAGNKKHSLRHREDIDPVEWKRKRKASANRTLTILKAALNAAWRDGKVGSDNEWRRVRPFGEADAARIRFLTVDEAKRLINACDPDFRLLVQAALMTGCRYGELARLTVADFDADRGALRVRRSKSGKPRDVEMAEEGREFFAALCAGQIGSKAILLKADGSAWNKSGQQRPIAQASKNARISPPVNFHAIRHTWATLAIKNRVPLMVVARNLGHVDTRMVERHYGNLDKDYIASEVRAGAQQFGIKAGNVASIR